MVSLRRFGPLIGLFLLAITVLAARLWDVQVREHETWAREAANLVRSWFVEPYARGRILDAEGRVLARDVEAYELEFVWRDFRRGHPLGQVAALRSLAVGRPVSLEETRLHLETWAEEFTRLSPAEIDAFGRGEALVLGSLVVPAVEGSGRGARRRAREERRGARAGDLHFYVKALLHPSADARRALPSSRGDEGWSRPYVELVAEAEGLDSTQERAARLRDELGRSLEHLDRLAGKVHFDEKALPAAIRDLAASRDRLVALIEDTRRETEADIADDLFRRAAGFDPTRLSEANLARLDLDWLRRALVWDEGRLAGWREDRGAAWSRAAGPDGHLPAYAISRSKLGDGETTWAEDRVLSSLAYAFNGDDVRTLPGTAQPRHWADVDELAVLSDLVGHLAGGAMLRPEVRAPVLPFQDPELARVPLGRGDRLRVAFAGLSFPAPPEPLPEGRSSDPFEFAVETCLLVSGKQQVREWRPGEDTPFAIVLEAWDRSLQARIAELFDGLPAPVALAEAWVDQALEARRYVVRDRGARPARFGTDPPYDLVRLVTRYPERYAGFSVRAVTERQLLEFLDPDSDAEPPVPVAAGLIGRVRPPALLNLLRQRPEELALAKLQRKLELLEDDRDEILEYVGSSWQEGTSTGGSGLESFLDPALRGRNGYRERTGLQDRKEGNRAPIYEEAVDGQDVRLTLDIDLQRAAQLLLEDPGPPPESEDRPDRVWHDFPVGALCLVSVEGDVIVAASGPSHPDYPLGPGVYDGQRSLALERTLRQHGFQPPGSVIKPFVAAWALDRGWITEKTNWTCTDVGGGLGAYRTDARTVRCHGVHYDVGLRKALTLSCNSYFAAVGETSFTTSEMLAMGHAFGFDSPTGISDLGVHSDLTRGRVAEDWRSSSSLWRQDGLEANPFTLGSAANGLICVTATPLQVARAYAALATGSLPQLRLVDRVGEVVVPRMGTPLPIDRPSLDVVRAMLAEVPISGTARHKGLDRDTLGFALACKTGSADFHAGLVPVNPLAAIDANTGSSAWEDGMRKHGWVAGWFPVERPRWAVVAYVHDTSTTSSHVATHLLSRFLTLPELQGWLAKRGVGEGE